MKNSLIRKLVVPMIASALAFGACAGREPVKADNLVGRSANPANAKSVSEMSVPEQVLIYFGVPVEENQFGDLNGLEETQNSYKVVSCVDYADLSMSRAQTMLNASSEILRAQGKNQGKVLGLRPFKSRRINNSYCVGYTAEK